MPETSPFPQHADPPLPSSPAAESSRVFRQAQAAMLGLAALFFALHFVHLKADFPNHSFWQDWAKYTDEGWYGDAAIRHYQLGHWNVPGDFNPAAALPVWPALELVLFRVTGVSLVAARALTCVVFGLVLVCVYSLLRRWVRRPSLVPAAVVLLLAVNPFCFVFFRLAILEPLLVLLTLVGLLVATRAGEADRPLRWALLLGILLPAMVLTKTTAIFLMPSILWMLWAASGYRWRRSLRAAAIAGAVAAVLWCLFYFAFVRPRYLTDYTYLFAANAYTGFKWSTLGDTLFNTLFDGIWIGKTLFALALFAMVGTLVGLCAKGFRLNPLPATMMLWIFGYGAFLAYHANLQPRYYLVVAVPLTVLVMVVFEPVLHSALRTWSTETAPDVLPAGAVDVLLLRIVGAVVALALAFVCLNAARQTLAIVLHPEYTWVDAAARVREAVDREVAAHPEHPRMLLSISGSDLSLITGLPSICDDFGSMTLSDRIGAYKPGWFGTWNEVEDDKMEALAPRYRLQRVLAVAAFDDPDRNLFILYRLDPLLNPGPIPPGRKRNIFVPKSLRSKLGEQPTPQQLKH